MAGTGAATEQGGPKNGPDSPSPEEETERKASEGGKIDDDGQDGGWPVPSRYTHSSVSAAASIEPADGIEGLTRLLMESIREKEAPRLLPPLWLPVSLPLMLQLSSVRALVQLPLPLLVTLLRLLPSPRRAGETAGTSAGEAAAMVAEVALADETCANT